jgi:Uma2 family endonuclease
MSDFAPFSHGPTHFRFTVDNYYLMTERGMFQNNTRTELIEGEILERPSTDPGHSGHVSAINQRLIRRLPQKYDVRCQLGLRISQVTEPEPDVAVVKARPDKYTKAHPTPAETLLVVEVSKTSLAPLRSHQKSRALCRLWHQGILGARSHRTPASRVHPACGRRLETAQHSDDPGDGPEHDRTGT